MNRETLKELGLTSEQIESVMQSHGKAIQAVKPDDYEDLKAEKETFTQQLSTLQGALDAQKTELSSVDDLKSENETLKLEKMKINIASQASIPFEFAERLSGATEEEIKADAEKMAGFFSQKPPALPLATTEPNKVDSEEKAYANMLENL